MSWNNMTLQSYLWNSHRRYRRCCFRGRRIFLFLFFFVNNLEKIKFLSGTSQTEIRNSRWRRPASFSSVLPKLKTLSPGMAAFLPRLSLEHLEMRSNSVSGTLVPSAGAPHLHSLIDCCFAKHPEIRYDTILPSSVDMNKWKSEYLSRWASIAL